MIRRSSIRREAIESRIFGVDAANFSYANYAGALDEAEALSISILETLCFAILLV